MKLILKLVFITLITGLVISCKKSSSSNSSYYLKANFDGTEKTFNSTVLASKSVLGAGVYNLSITGLNGTTEEGVVTLWSDKDDFTAGKTFTIDAASVGSYNIFGYTSPLGSSDPTAIWTSVYQYGVVDQSFSCTITESTSSYIKGTFSSVIYQENENTVVSKTITEGQFYAKY